MKQARVSELKNQLSQYLDCVRHGETVLVFDRNTPIAQIVPLSREPEREGSSEARLKRLEQQGVLRRGTGRLPKSFTRRKLPRFRGSVLKDLLREREESW
jgi:prevent-host-death family protein